MSKASWFRQAVLAGGVLFATVMNGCVGHGIDDVEFSPDSKVVAYESTSVWCPLWPASLCRATHRVCWRPSLGSDVAECGVDTGISGNLFLWPPRDQSVACLTFSPDGRHLAVERMDGAIMVIEIKSQTIWTLDAPAMENMDLAWASNDEVIYRGYRYVRTKEAIFVREAVGTWKQGIRQPAGSRVPATMPTATTRPSSHYELLARLRASDPNDHWRGQPSYTLSPDASYVAKVTSALLPWHTLTIFAAPSP